MDVHLDISRLLQRKGHASDRFGPQRVHALLHTLALDKSLTLGSLERAHILSKLNAHGAAVHRVTLCENLSHVLHETCFRGLHAPFGHHFATPPLLYFYHVVQTFAAALQMCGCPARVADAFTRDMLDIPVNHAFALGWEPLEAADYAYLFDAQADMFFVVACFFAEKVVAGVGAFRAAWGHVCNFHARFCPPSPSRHRAAPAAHHKPALLFLQPPRPCHPPWGSSRCAAQAAATTAAVGLLVALQTPALCLMIRGYPPTQPLPAPRRKFVCPAQGVGPAG